VCGRHPEKLRRLERLGFRTVSSPETLGREFDLVVEATGSAEGLRAALGLVRPLGTVVLKSTYQGAATIDLTPVVVHEVRVQGSRCGAFGPALEHLMANPRLTEGLVTARFALADAALAFDRAAKPDALKVLLDIG
jgi:threonine dehydrogenase-like Zn-dependent dehydrogenase